MQPIIQKHLHIHDTCGVHNLHGMPGVLAAFFGALIASLATEASYDYSLYEVRNSVILYSSFSRNQHSFTLPWNDNLIIISS